MSTKHSFVFRVLAAGATSQLALVLVGFIRLPFIVSTFGSTQFATFSSSLAISFLLLSVSEALRRTARELSKSNELRKSDFLKLAWPHVALVFVASFLLIAGVAMTHERVKPDITILILVCASGFVAIPVSFVIGCVEGQGQLTLVSQWTTILTLLSLPLTMIGCSLHSIIIVGLASVLPSSIPGLAAIRQFNKVPNQNYPARPENLLLLRNSYLSITASETLVYAVDGIVILAIAGPADASVFAIVQRVASAFAVAPVALAPYLAIYSSNQKSDKSVRLVQTVQVAIAVCLAISMLGGREFIFGLLSGGEIQPNATVVLSAVANGLVLSLCGPVIQSVTTGRPLIKRAKLAPLVAVSGLILNVLLIAILGASGAFIATAISTVLYALATALILRVRSK